jgi:hypothetical protein
MIIYGHETQRVGRTRMVLMRAGPWRIESAINVSGSIVRAHLVSLVSYIEVKALRLAIPTIRSPTPEVIGNDMSERQH